MVSWLATKYKVNNDRVSSAYMTLLGSSRLETGNVNATRPVGTKDTIVAYSFR